MALKVGGVEVVSDDRQLINITNVIPIGNGGTGAISVPGARTNLGATTTGSNLFTLQDQGGMTRYIRLNPDNTVTALESPAFKAALGIFNGPMTFNGIVEEKITAVSTATDVQYNYFNDSSVMYCNSFPANTYISFFNVPTTEARAINFGIIIQQSASANVPLVRINNVNQTIKWLGSAVAPTGSANKIDVVNFTLLRINNAWQVLGSLTSFG